VFSQLNHYVNSTPQRLQTFQDQQTERLLVALYSTNQLYLIIDNTISQIFNISNSPKGINNELGSHGNPEWIMTISDIVWDDQTDYSVFARKQEKKWIIDQDFLDNLQTNHFFCKKSYMISRLLILNWLEPENQNVYSRWIYLHGTVNGWLLNSEFMHQDVFSYPYSTQYNLISAEAINKMIKADQIHIPRFSHGCFGMHKQDVIELSNIVQKWDLFISLR